MNLQRLNLQVRIEDNSYLDFYADFSAEKCNFQGFEMIICARFCADLRYKNRLYLLCNYRLGLYVC